MRRRTLISAISAMAISTGILLSGPVRAGDAEDVAAIEGLWTTYSTAVVAGDAETWLALWDEGGIQMPPGTPARSFDVLKAEVPGSFKPGVVSSMNIHPEEITVGGDWAYSRGTYDIDEAGEAGPVHFEGKFMTILRRQPDGSWKIYRDIFNSNNP